MGENHSRGFSPACLDAATLAALVDRTLDSASRARVVAHVASCPDCSELVAEVIQTTDELPADLRMVGSSEAARDATRSAGKVLPMRRRGLAAAAGLVAIAASLLLLVVLNRGSELDTLVEVVGNERLTLARPTGNFHFGPVRAPLRGPQNTDDLQLAAEVARLRERAGRTGAASDLHAAGIAQLVAGDSTGAIASLRAAARSKPEDPRFISDLGAAYMTRFVDRDEADDATIALEMFDRAVSLSPSLEEAWFNRALLLERMNRPADALSSWNKYLELPDDGPWRDEAIRNRDAVQRQIQGR